MARILAVGVGTLDVINEVPAYPREDAELRALAHMVRRGGNATNTLVVLSQLGHACDWAGVLVDEPDAVVITDELTRYGIQTQYCMTLAQGRLPTSYITLSRQTGSRTIVHYRDVPEYDYAAFSRIPLAEFDWVHFEGRNVRDTTRMMQRVRDQHPALKVSLEVEKPRAAIEQLFAFADLILVSQAYARSAELSPEKLLARMYESVPRADIVCTLGHRGSIGLNREGEPVKVGAFPQAKIIDTLGAGDTFNAAMIDAGVRRIPLENAMRFAAALSGNKCAQVGLHGLDIPAYPGD